MSARSALDAPLASVRGIGPRRAAALAERRLVTVEDLLYMLPIRYEDRRRFARLADLEIGGAPATLNVEVGSVRVIRTRRRGFTIVEAALCDPSGTIPVRWFNQPYLARSLPEGTRLAVYGGLVGRGRGSPALENPEIERLEVGDAGLHTGRVVPVYRRVGPLTSRALRSLIARTLEGLGEDDRPDLLPRSFVDDMGLPSRVAALRAVHFPPEDADPRELEALTSPAHRRLALEEMFALQEVLAILRAEREARGRRPPHPASVERYVGALPFVLTAGQSAALADVLRDLRRGIPMNRLLHGDVGSGKTVVALLAVLAVADGGRQAALLAPTEALAEQHERTARSLFERLGVAHAVVRLSGSLSAPERRAAAAGLADGRIALAIGTHALLQTPVRFRDLGLVIVDEQHRFGVCQRAAMLAKGSEPDVLVLSATPIPRSVAMTLYGDLDASRIVGLPAGRPEVRTLVREIADRERVYDGVRRAVEAGGRAFVIVPAVEARGELHALTQLADWLRHGPLHGVGIGAIHGRMRADARREALARLASGETPVLVATTVIEVGIDVAEANVVVVENAERFGLAQLHQIRGRVGRGTARSWCVLIAADDASAAARARLAVLVGTRDGFEIAERDLELRGPGEVLATDQHGPADLSFLALAVRRPEQVARIRELARAEIAALGTGARAAVAARVRSGWRERLRDGAAV